MPFGPWEIVIILIILVVVFGAGRLAQVGGALGKSVREFLGAVQEEPKQVAAAAPAPPPLPPAICASCEVANPATNKFCSACGTALTSPIVEVPSPAAAPENTCPSCATVNPPDQAFCGQCGTRLTRAA